MKLHPSTSKYKNQGVRHEDGYFHSKKELARWLSLKLLVRAGEISDLKRQVPVPLHVNGELIVTMKVDFQYTELDKGHAKQIVFEDTKGYPTRDWEISAKLFKALRGQEIRIS